jgi:CheY-like chemotaxis protein
MDTESLAFRVIEHYLESNDNLRTLATLADRVEPLANELSEAWIAIDKNSADQSERAAQYDGLIQQLQAFAHADDLRALYLWVAVQGGNLALSGVEYDELLRRCEAFHRASLPIIARAYEPGAQLELALSALEEVYNAATLILGTAYLQMVQDRVLPGLRLQTVGRLASGMTHALNNALTVIVGRAQVLAYTIHDETVRNELGDIQNAALTAAGTIRRLQDFARSSRETELGETDVNSAVSDAIEITRFRWRDEAERTGFLIAIARDLADVPPVRANSGLLREIFVEVILDGIATMPRGGIMGFRTERVGDDVLVSVSHSGEEAEPSSEGGDDAFASMGLTQARTLLDIFGGTLDVVQSKDVRERSTVVNVRLPIAVTSVEEPVLPQKNPANGLRVLIVEDEIPIRDVIGQIVARQGHQATEADSGSDAVREIAEQEPFDLIVTDLGMAGVSSWEIAETARNKSARTLVVLVTGWSAELNTEKLRTGGIAHVLQKPFSERQLLAVLTEAKELRERM